MTPQRGTRSIVATVRHAVDASLSAPRVVLAVSGGIDSMVLLDAAANGRRRRGRELIVATFDHGTGAAAASSSELVERVAAEQGLECVVGRALGLRRSEAAWREARWKFLRTLAVARSAAVATAHTADDQIETILMRVLRDAGPRGLAALEAPSDVLRPMLTFRRTAITAYATARGVNWSDDPSNDSLAFLRNRVRRDLLPALRRADPGFDEDVLALGRTAAAWRRETDAVARDVSQLRGTDAIEVDLESIRTLGTTELSLLWPAIAGRLGLALDRRGTLRLAAFGRSSRVGSRVQVSGGWEAVRSRNAVRLGRAAQTVGAETTLDVSTATRWDGWTFWPRADGCVASDARRGPGWEADLPADRPLRVRGWRPGDRFVVGSGGLGRKVKRLLSDAGVTGHERTGWPVVVCEDRIVWVPGVRRSGAATERSGRPSLHFSCARYSG